MHKPTRRERFLYAFDNTLTRGPVALVAWLGLAMIAVILLAAGLDLLIGGVAPSQGLGPAQIVWSFIYQALVPNPPGSFDVPWQFLATMLVVTVLSLLGVSILIGLISSGIAYRVERLRRGRSRIIEEGHTIILGWSPQVFTIVAELALANRSRRSACVAILAERDKVEMEEEIREKVPQIWGTRVVCRSGSPADQDDLKIVSPEAARAIIIVSPGGPYPDLPVAKTMLALRRDPDLRTVPYHIVAALRRSANLQIGRIIGGDEVSLFLVDGLISRLIAQTCRQPGLSTVYAELLSFEGQAIYFHHEPALAGRTFGEALLSYENSALLGLQRGDGLVVICPAMDTPIAAGDRVIALAAGEDAVVLGVETARSVEADAIREAGTATPAPDTILMLGWNDRAPLILEQLGNYGLPGSRVDVVAALEPARMQGACAATQFGNLRVNFRNENPQERATLERLADEGHRYIVILSPSDVADPQIADASSMITLLHLRDIAATTARRFSIVSEILDQRNRDLVELTSADDVIISERLIALALAQIAENRDVLEVFKEFLSPGGSEIYLKPVGDYVALGRPVNFYTVVESARCRGEAAIGYRLLSEVSDPKKAYGVHLNPAKQAPVTFAEQDRVVVLAESEWR